MAARANWKGYLKLSLVSCAVALFPATTTRERVRFNIINRKTGHRVRYEVVDSETGREVPQEERLKGYKIGSDYVLLDGEELDKVALESTHTIDIDSFVPHPPEPGNVVNLTDALRRSVKAGRRGTGKRTTHGGSAERRHRSTGRKKLKRAR